MILEKKLERLLILFLSLSLFIGIWHGYPFTNIVADEMFFSGSVLRSIEHHTALPLALDVPYGTLTFYISYIFISLCLVVIFILKSLDVEALKLFVIHNPFLVYFVSRLVSYVLAVLSIIGLNYFLKKYIVDYRYRLTLVFLLFTNILVNVIFHTSKVWVLSTVLMLLSFCSLVLVFDGDEKNTKKYIWYSVFFAFLSFSNFPFMGLNLLVIPIIAYKYRKHKEYRNTLIKSIIWGGLVFFLVLASNFSGIKEQIRSIIFDYSLSKGALEHNLSTFGSLLSHFKKIVLLFPIFIITWAYVAFTSKVKNKNLFKLSFLYLTIYIILIILVDKWSVGDQSSLRYLFPLPFFFTLILSSYEFGFKKMILIPVALSVVYFVPTLYYLSISTTSNNLVEYIKEVYASDADSVFVNNVGVDAPLPQNKKSYLLVKNNECGSLCKSTIKYDLENNFGPYVLDSHTDISKTNFLNNKSKIYFLERNSTTTKEYELVKSFTNPVKDNKYFSADSSGSYLDLSYFRVRNYGPNLYIYKKI